MNAYGALAYAEHSQKELNLMLSIRIRNLSECSELEFLKSPWRLGTEEEESYRTGPPGYIGWRNSFLGIDSGAPYTFKSTGSACA